MNNLFCETRAPKIHLTKRPLFWLFVLIFFYFILFPTRKGAWRTNSQNHLKFTTPEIISMIRSSKKCLILLKWSRTIWITCLAKMLYLDLVCLHDLRTRLPRISNMCHPREQNCTRGKYKKNEKRSFETNEQRRKSLLSGSCNCGKPVHF